MQGKNLRSFWNRGARQSPAAAFEKEVAEVSVSSDNSPQDTEKAAAPLTPEGVMEALKDVFDPELAINVVELGLIYGVEIEGRSVAVRMTLTSPGCPIGPMLQAMARGAITRVFPDVEDVKVDLVWSPPWDPYKMASEEAKDMLGIW